MAYTSLISNMAFINGGLSRTTVVQCIKYRVFVHNLVVTDSCLVLCMCLCTCLCKYICKEMSFHVVLFSSHNNSIAFIS